MRHTTSRAQRYGGHTKHTFYCSCGRQVAGNGGKQHFKLDGHHRVTWERWRQIVGEAPGDGPLFQSGYDGFIA